VNNLLIAIMYPSKEMLDLTMKELENKFGKIISHSPEYNFNFTNYYEKEFGTNLKKIILVFEQNIEKAELVEIREWTGNFEKRWSQNENRTVNIDPGYISKEELVLATKKGKWFKEDLGNGVFAHKVLEFKDGEAITFKHTFADYRLESNLKFFREFLEK
jgi:hypothetical protein